MPGSPEEIKLVNNAMSNTTRRKIMNLLKDSGKSKEEIGKIVGKTMLDYHLQLLKQAGLIVTTNELMNLSDFGKNLLESNNEQTPESKNDLTETRSIDFVEIRQFLPCIADNSKYRIIARMEPPLQGALKLLEPLFPRTRYSDKLGVLIIQKGNIMITTYSTGNVTMTMISSTQEAKQILEDLKRNINEAIENGITPTPRENIRVDHTEIYKYLPQTNCGICGEQSCYSFAIRLVAKETTLDKCTPLLEDKYAVNMEHLKIIMEYL